MHLEPKAYADIDRSRRHLQPHFAVSQIDSAFAWQLGKERVLLAGFTNGWLIEAFGGATGVPIGRRAVHRTTRAVRNTVLRLIRVPYEQGPLVAGERSLG